MTSSGMARWSDDPVIGCLTRKAERGVSGALPSPNGRLRYLCHHMLSIMKDAVLHHDAPDLCRYARPLCTAGSRSRKAGRWAYSAPRITPGSPGRVPGLKF